MSTGKTLLFIDGENFRYKSIEVLENAGFHTSAKSILDVDFTKLFASTLTGLQVNEFRYYSAKIHLHPATKKKSLELIKIQRILKTKLEKENFKWVVSGNVRVGLVSGKCVFNEKGVDVKIAVDLVLAACDKIADTVILCSSDSDLQPAIKEAVARGLNIVYLGFSSSPNKGLVYTTSKTILLKDSDIIKAYTP